jgi:hypothetical protein
VVNDGQHGGPVGMEEERVYAAYNPNMRKTVAHSGSVSDQSSVR